MTAFERALPVAFGLLLIAASVAAVDYHVSSSLGDDGNDGTSTDTPLRTLSAASQLDLQPGDRLLLRCGDTWRAEVLHLTDSGTVAEPIVVTSYPEGCADRPVLSGAQKISGWQHYSDDIWMADLGAGANTGLFDGGINQLIRDSRRLTLGRWPNLDEGDGGWASVDSQPAGNRLTDSALPATDWSGAALHLRTIRWLIVNREVTATSGTTLTLNESVSCNHTPSCAEWGYFINHHMATLDRDGEWYFDAATERVYLVDSTGPPADGAVEGSVLLLPESDDQLDHYGAIVLGRHLWEHITDVEIANLEIVDWFANGISAPLNSRADENQRVTIRDCVVRRVDKSGIKLTTWAWDAATFGNGPDGWRGGRELEIRNNVIDGANHFGIDTYARQSLIADNEIRNVGVLENLGRSGLGCGFSGANCTENGAGIRIKLDPGKGVTATGNTIRRNRIQRVAMNGIDLFGPENLLEHNVIDRACATKGDCGGIRTFGRDNLASTEVYDVTLRGTIVRDVIGDTHGCHPSFRDEFGFGLYLDHYSRDLVVEDTTVAGCTVHGVLIQNSTATVTGTTAYGNSTGPIAGAELVTTGSVASAATSDNILYLLNGDATTLSVANAFDLTSSTSNRYLSPFASEHIRDWSQGWQRMDLAAWQALSGLDASSSELWFSLAPGELPISRLFVNDTASQRTIDLCTRLYVGLDQQAVSGSLTLDPFRSRILIENGWSGPGPIGDADLSCGTDAADLATIVRADSDATFRPLGDGDCSGNGDTDNDDIPCAVAAMYPSEHTEVVTSPESG